MPAHLTYKKAGVDIAKANRFVGAVKALAATTLTKAVLNRPGTFGALYEMDVRGIKNPVLVSSTDGVGTKLLVAGLAGRHDTVGIDLVAMNANDILCAGARPLFFLDYLAVGKLNPAAMKEVMKGIVLGCRQSGCALIGGETAEMPDMYQKESYDLAGFVVGIVDRGRIIDGSSIKSGDVLIGLPSSGLHANGYSLARKALPLTLQKSYANILLKPTCIYVRPVLDLIAHLEVKGMAHMTGGAWYEKLTKMLPPGLCFEVTRGSWPVPRIFTLIADQGHVPQHDMFRTFNMGIGFALAVAPNKAAAAHARLLGRGMTSFVIGRVIKDERRKVVFI